MPILSTDWHWLKYHFSPYMDGYEHFLCASVINSCYEIEKVIPGYVKEFSSRLSSLSNREKFQPHYEQIIQLLAELYVIYHFSTIGFDKAEYTHEPTVAGCDKNPELGISLKDHDVFIEVKCREYITHHNNRGESSIEVPSRMDGIRKVAEAIVNDDETIVYPRDNTIKEFLISADEKFSGFKKDSPRSVTLLVIIWDDFIYEPISSLLNSSSGLLTENSFYLKSDNLVKFENIDAILLVRQSHQIVRATRDELPVDGLSHPLDWGLKNEVLPKAYIPVNASEETSRFLCKILQAHDISELNHVAEYRPQELIFHV